VGRRKKKHEHVNHERWLVSYADFITLLFAFFVVMFAVSQVDSGKLGRLSEGINAAFPLRGIFGDNGSSPLTRGGGGSSIVPLIVAERPSFLTHAAPSPRARSIHEALEARLREADPAGVVSLRYDPRGVVVSLPGRDFFRAATATLRPDALDDLRAIADLVGAERCSLQIEAHTAETETSSDLFASNWELSAARAACLARFLVDEAGFDPERLSAAGFAGYRPLAGEPAEEHPRVDLVLVTETAGG
jgi:chemotaxis protein MotB